VAISSLGIGSNLDINGIITGLMQIESQPLTVLATREASYQAKLTAYGSLKGALSTFQTAISGLTSASKFQTIKATSSNTDAVTASASSIASAGSYSLNVSQIAQTQSLVAAGQSSITTAIGAGTSTTITFDFGEISGGTLTAYDAVAGTGGTYSGASFTSNGNGTKSITIDSSNNSLSGIRDAINSAGMGVTASIVNDGGASPYRLVLTSNSQGESNSMKISVSGDATLSSLLAHDPTATQNLQETVAAQNTELTVNGVFVSQPGSSLTDVIKGVTLNVLETGTSKITVAQDTSGINTSVNGFITAYNELNTTLKGLTSYDPSTKTAAILQGDSAARSIQSQIRSLLGSSLAGAGAYTSLSQIGISFQANGSLALDSTKFQNALSSNAKDVAAVFASIGAPTDSLVSYVGATSSTKAGSYALSVSQLATKGTLVGSAAGNLTITAGVNDTLDVSLDGVSTTITLAAATYASASALASEIQSKINGASSFSTPGLTVAVSESAGVFTITSNSYGSSSKVSLSGNAADGLFGAGRTSTDGLDVSGTLDGVEGTGAGQNLTGGSGSNAYGLQVLINGGSTGDRGVVSYSQGFAVQLNKLVQDILGSTGTLASATNGLARRIEDIGDRREILNRRLEDIEARYRKQYSALDTLISNMNQTSSYLSQQLASLAGSRS
jgi:flagellar hook-associated protein 2